MKIGILGSGDVAKVLSSGFLKHGHEVMLGTRDSTKLIDWSAKNPEGRVGSFEQTAKFGETVVLAIKGTAALDVLRAAGAPNLIGKPIIDTTIPTTDDAPVDGVLKFFTNLNGSLMERLQDEFPEANFVKAFNSVGNNLMVNPPFKSSKPTMFICGNNEAAKEVVTSILDQFGWDTADMGTARVARAIEPLSMLWCIPGLLRNEWTHAFALLKE